MDVDVEVPVKGLGDPTRCPARGVFSFLGWVPFQETLDFLLDLVGDFRRASVPPTVVEARGPFFVEPVTSWISTISKAECSRILKRTMCARTDTRPTS